MLFGCDHDTLLQATNRGFISAAKEYQAGEELTFDYGLLNDAVLAFYGNFCRVFTPACFNVFHVYSQAFLLPTAVASGGDRVRFLMTRGTVPNSLRFC